MSIWRFLFQRKAALVGCAVLLTVLFAALAAPLVAPYDPYDFDPLTRLLEPSATHFLGTDHFGRDSYSRLIYGARMALLIGFCAVCFALAGGVSIGVVSAWHPRLGAVLMRGVDVLLAFPSLLLALALIVILGQGIVNSIVAVGSIYLASTARIIYSFSLRVKAEPYVEAAIASGASGTRIILRHILPNLISPILVQASFIFAFAQLAAASLDFLGLGIPPEIPSWGNMLSESRRYITRAPWLLIYPGLMLVLTSFALNLVGDALRDRLDPRFRGL